MPWNDGPALPFVYREADGELLTLFAVVATMACLPVIDWITGERLGARAPYSIAAALVLLMVLSLGAMPRAAARQQRAARPPGAARKDGP